MKKTILFNQISQNQTVHLLNLIFPLCNQVAFHIPDLFSVFLTENNKRIHSIFSHRTFENASDDRYFKYLGNVNSLLNQLDPWLLECYVDVCFMGQVFQYKTKVCLFRLDESMLQIIADKAIYDWQFPKFPEDISFLQNGKCVLQTISHENFACLYTSDSKTKKSLQEIGIPFFCEPCSLDEIPIWTPEKTGTKE